MSASERNEFLAWYEGHKDEVFHNRRVLESTVRTTRVCRVLRRELIQIVNIYVFLESVTITSAYNKVMRKRFLKSNTIGFIPSGGYSCNVNYSNKAIMLLVYREKTDGCTIKHARNQHEYRLPELPRSSVDGFCAETRTV